MSNLLCKIITYAFRASFSFQLLSRDISELFICFVQQPIAVPLSIFKPTRLTNGYEFGNLIAYLKCSMILVRSAHKIVDLD